MGILDVPEETKLQTALVQGSCGGKKAQESSISYVRSLFPSLKEPQTQSLPPCRQYAPKDKQTPALCSDPQSTCDADYGFSIGRGSFSYAPGAWTTVAQTVVLNTPGKQDGSFTLRVNGEVIIDRSDIYYRGAIKRSTTTKKDRTKTSTKKHTPQETKTKDGDGGLLGPILGGILGNLAVEATATEMGQSGIPTPTSSNAERGDLGGESANASDGRHAHSMDHILASTRTKSVPMTGIFFRLVLFFCA